MEQWGPPSKPPTTLKIIPRNEAESTREKDDEFAAPDYLTEEGKKVWNDLVHKLVDLKLVSNVDLNAFGRYCDIIPKWMKAKRFLDENGFYYTIYAKQTAAEIKAELPPRVRFLQTYPEVPIYRDLGRELGRLENLFGLNPSARSGIKVSKLPGKSSTAKKLFG